MGGGATRLASTLGVKVNVVTNWRGRRTVPAEHVLAIEAATGVSRYDLRPDVFGPAPVQNVVGPQGQETQSGPPAASTLSEVA
jgi:DNA-binding transcriptional regulator YdaS (Cro superfamily)